MEVKSTILTTLAVLGMTQVGCAECDNTGALGPFDVSFTLDEVTVQDVIGDETWAGGDEVTPEMCTSLCDYAFRGDLVAIENCETEWVQPMPSEEQEFTSSLLVECDGTANSFMLCGRRPHEYAEPETVPADALAAFLVQSAHLEACSVVAFRELARQLKQLGATQDLIQRCLEAAEDEVLHTRLMTELAEAEHVTVPEVALPVQKQISLFEIARHNAIEGCVYETWAAVQAHVYAQTAADPKLRSVMARIAEDETRHGQLAWDLHTWFMGQVTEAQRLQITEEQAEALAELPQHARLQARGLPHELGRPKHSFEQVARVFIQRSGCGGMRLSRK